MTNSSPTLTANATGAMYQWIDCATMLPISSETNQSFTATANGSYAVIVTENACTDTSACESVTGLAITELSYRPEVILYPNPNQGDVIIDLGRTYNNVNVKIRTITGQEISSTYFGRTDKIFMKVEAPAGFYFINIETEGGYLTILKLVKN
ncbi:MAG: T9SS type A sorting domain-containing protein [Bacteroidetes bacterium]|nr:T9SS type A sorting domain-containing protein [Bacteroidota bacterium]